MMAASACPHKGVGLASSPSARDTSDVRHAVRSDPGRGHGAHPPRGRYMGADMQGQARFPRDRVCPCSHSAAIPLPNPGLHGMHSLGAYADTPRAVWRECLRVSRPGGVRQKAVGPPRQPPRGLAPGPRGDHGAEWHFDLLVVPADAARRPARGGDHHGRAARPPSLLPARLLTADRIERRHLRPDRNGPGHPVLAGRGRRGRLRRCASPPGVAG